MRQSRSRNWSRITAAVTAQYRALPDAEKHWIEERLLRIERLQLQLHEIFETGAGAQLCAGCGGNCCAAGHNHMTLVNLLMFLRREEHPPAPDFGRECPFSGAAGCLLAAGSRPYNCISFICDIIETNLPDQQTARFYLLEKQLRNLYLEFAQRYRGAALSGLLLQSPRLAGQSFFSPTPAATERAEGPSSCR